VVVKRLAAPNLQRIVNSMVNLHPEAAAEDGVFAALADPTRRTLLRRLAAARASTLALHDGLAMSLPALLKHLHVLERARLVTRQKQGRTCYYQLDPRGAEPAQRFLEEMRRFWSVRLDELGRHLDTLTAGDPS
jgi:DNA-binding transcriptional ArsR family regulator